MVLTIAAYLAISAHRNKLPGLGRPIGGGICFLAGFWVLATHVPLIADAAHGKAAWGSALWHASTALPIVVLALWTVVRDA